MNTMKKGSALLAGLAIALLAVGCSDAPTTTPEQDLVDDPEWAYLWPGGVIPTGPFDQLDSDGAGGVGGGDLFGMRGRRTNQPCRRRRHRCGCRVPHPKPRRVARRTRRRRRGATPPGGGYANRADQDRRGGRGSHGCAPRRLPGGPSTAGRRRASRVATVRHLARSSGDSRGDRRRTSADGTRVGVPGR